MNSNTIVTDFSIKNSFILILQSLTVQFKMFFFYVNACCKSLTKKVFQVRNALVLTLFII